MGYRLSKIYTRTGDTGETGLADGSRVRKDHPRIEAIGDVDELNSMLGVLLAELEDQQVHIPELVSVIDVLTPCQHRLLDLGGELAMPDYRALDYDEIERLEQAIDTWNEELASRELHPARRFTRRCVGSYRTQHRSTCRAALPDVKPKRAARRCRDGLSQPPFGLAVCCRTYHW